MTKKAQKPESTDVVPEPFFVPEYGMTVMATSPAEAVEIAKEKAEEKETISNNK